MNYKNDFIKFMYDSKVLTFGDFTAKSGRKTPYFVNTGNYKTGKQIAKLGEFYAKCMKDNNISGDVLFGPAYKGIPLCTTTAIALSNLYDEDYKFCFNRKEEKDHGEGGTIIGYKPADKENIIIIEDVITAGTAIRETLPVLKAVADVNITDIIISVDRMEKGTGETSAVQEIKANYGINVTSIVTIEDIISALENGIVEGKEFLPKMLEYRKIYGI